MIVLVRYRLLADFWQTSCKHFLAVHRWIVMGTCLYLQMLHISVCRTEGLKIDIAIGTPGEAIHWLRVGFELVVLRSIGYSIHE